MSNDRRIKRKIEKKYKHPIDNIYSHRFYSDLFSGYAYSLAEDKIGRNDFYIITPDDKEIVNLFKNISHYDFSYEFGQTIDRVLYSLAAFGKAYIFVEPEYIDIIDEKGGNNRVINSIHIREVKGILRRNIFYYNNYSEDISKIDIGKGVLITYDLRDLGYKRNYFTKLVKQLGKYDTTSTSIDLISNEPTYDFNAHLDKNRKRFLRKVKEIEWSFGSDGISDSYILYKEIKMRQFKQRFLQYVLEKTNYGLAEVNITGKEFRIEAMTGNTDYDDVWKRFQDGIITVSELSNIVWNGIND